MFSVAGSADAGAALIPFAVAPEAAGPGDLVAVSLELITVLALHSINAG